MTNFTRNNKTPEIDQNVIAYDVAPSANLDRSIAAAKRLIDPIAAEVKGLGDSDYDATWSRTMEIAAYYDVYPEVFNALFRSSKDKTKLKGKELMRIATEIAENGELSLSNLVGWEEHGTVEQFDHRAELTEAATEATLVYPPTQAFLKDHDLGKEEYNRETKEYERKVTADQIVKLPLSAEELDHEYARALNDFAQMNDYYAKFDPDTNPGSSRLQRLSYMLERACAFMQGEHQKKFESRIRAARNTEKTEVGYFYVLYREGMDQVLDLIADKAKKKRETFAAILDGSASTYVSPVAESAKTTE